MKNYSFLFVVVFAFIAISCGKDNGSGIGGGGINANQQFSTDPYVVSTVNGLINTVNGSIEVNGSIYQPSQQSVPILSNAINLAIQQGLQPTMSNNVMKWKVRITGSLEPSIGYSLYQNNNSQRLLILNVQQAVIYR